MSSGVSFCLVSDITAGGRVAGNNEDNAVFERLKHIHCIGEGITCARVRDFEYIAR